MAIELNTFRNNSSGEASVKTALLFGAVAMALSVLAAPVLQDATEKIAENRAFGVDRVITGSLNKSKNKKYIVRKSVLSKEEELIEIDN